MKKIAAILTVLMLVASFTGCINGKSPVEKEKVVPVEDQKPLEEEITGDDPAAQEISLDMAEIESIEEDLDISDLEGLENDLDAIVW